MKRRFADLTPTQKAFVKKQRHRKMRHSAVNDVRERMEELYAGTMVLVSRGWNPGANAWAWDLWRME